MPIPKEFNCDEVRLNQREIETFKTAILNLSGIVKNNEPYDVSKEVRKRIPVREARNFSKAETDSIYAQEHEKAVARDEKFLADNKAACKNGLLALKTLPDGRDPKSMFMWVKQFPELLSRNNVNLAFDRYGKELSLNEDDRQTLNKNFELAKSWYSLFSGPNYFNKLYGIPGSEEYYHDLAENFLKKFQAKADELNIPTKDEERIAEETGAFDAPENPAEEEEIQNAVIEEKIKIEVPKEPLIEEEIPKAVPAEKEKIKPIGISKRIHLTENAKTFDKKVNDFLNRGFSLSEEIQAKLKSNNFQNLGNINKMSAAQLFEQNYGDVIQNEMAAMLAGPKEHSSDGGLEWLKTFPHLIAMIGSVPSLATACLSGRKDFSKEHLDLAREWHMFLKDGYPGNFESDHVIHTGAKADESFVKYENKLYDKAWAVVHKNEKTKIDSLVEKLENAKTFTNSDEYKQIISLSKMLYHADELPQKFKEQVSPDTPEARHAFKLTSIKAQIDAYIDHKAKDGVKPNVYHKLAAVEELNRYVCEELNRIGVKNIPAGAPKISVVNGKVPTSLEEEPGAQTLNSYHVVPRFDVEEKECRCTLDCMSRIMLRADAMNLGEETMHKLDQLATAFQKGPDVDLEALQKQQEAPKTGLLDEDLDKIKPLTMC